MKKPLLPQKYQPTIPLILKGKKNIRQKSELQQHSMTSSNNIRMSLDNNLGDIFTILRKKKQRTLGDRRIYRPQLQQNFQQIPKLNDKLVRDYIQLIYHDYNIRDPLGDISQNQYNINQLNQGALTDRKMRNRNNKNSITNSNRRAVHLKQSFLIQMFSPNDKRYVESPYQYKRKQESSHGNTSTHPNTYTNNHTLTNFSFSPQKTSKQINSYTEGQEVKSVYRYCFICEEPILEANIQIHQRIRCPEFSTLYKMSPFQLRETLMRKIQRMHSQALQKQQKIKNCQQMNKNFSDLFTKTQQYLAAISSQIFHNKNSKPANLMQTRKNIRAHFQYVINRFEIDYFKLYELVKKLQWFVSMYINLQNTIQQKQINIQEPRERLTMNRELKPKRQHQSTDRRFSLAH